ncbi:MAG: M28 family peptidase [Fibrobacteres bacterium]|nr:M28 family peptidase [Fibrobacterota bacterium]
MKIGFSICLLFLLFPELHADNPTVSQEALRSHVEALTSLPVPRNFSNMNSLKASYRYITDQFDSVGLEPILHKFKIGSDTFVNIIGTINPEKEEIIVIGAHYDVCGDQQGADDNASGVAGLIELAKILSAHKSDIKYQIQFVGWTNEEPPFFKTPGMGSYQHAKLLHSMGKKVKLAISLEMIGYFTDSSTQEYPTFLMKPFYPSKGNWIAAVSNFGSRSYLSKVKKAINKNTDIYCRTLFAPKSVVGIDFSDHWSYWQFGYDAIMITNTSFYRTPHYHKKTDTPETLDYIRMGEVVKGVAYFIKDLN